MQNSRLPRFFWDFRVYIERARAGGINFTPSIALIMALDAALRRAEAEGWDNVFRRHAAVAAQCRAGLRARVLDDRAMVDLLHTFLHPSTAAFERGELPAITTRYIPPEEGPGHADAP
jgi:aspartate aminotransferase-like enzyme